MVERADKVYVPPRGTRGSWFRGVVLMRLLADHPGWFYNLARNPDKVWVQVGNGRFRAEVETLQSAEREEACARLVRAGSHIADLQKKTDRQIPVVRVRTASSES